MTKLPVYEFVIKNDVGMTAISFVDSPAIESEFIAFENAVPTPKYIQLEGYKQIVAGLALIPDKLIYRIDQKTGEEYYGYFSADTIVQIRDKFHKDKQTSNVNLQHNEQDFIDSYLVESYILDTPERVQEVLNKGIKEACLGSWFVAYKVEDIEAFNEVLNGTFHGFSIEIMLDRELKLNKNKNNTIMNKFNRFIEGIKNLLSSVELEDVKLTDALLADGSKTIRYNEVGTPVNFVSLDDTGAEVLELAPAGDYIIESGEVVVVDDMGNLVEVKPAEAPVEPVSVDPNPTPIVAEEQVPFVDPVIDPNAVDPNAVDPNMMPTEGEPAPVPTLDVTISQIVGNKDGEYWIKVCVEGGLITEAEVSSEVSLLNSQIEELKSQLKLPIAEPVKTDLVCNPKKKLTKAEIAKMNNLEYQLYKLGLSK